MAKQATTAPESLGFGDLGVIRNILMGEQIAKIDSSLADQNEQIDKLRGVLSETEKSILNTMAQIERRMNDRLDALEVQLNQNDKKQSADLQSAISAERKELSTLFRSVSEQLGK